STASPATFLVLTGFLLLLISSLLAWARRRMP
ncbi:MAG: LPXTG cell wall anchor domain-containing protein, partial [Candidatus Electrothrix sp. AR4]|nr:LPXTG cell wall anchor domain-containing protein [Candidatus Electrothrix sp. AR4]